jgi:ketosteroid isomerase-like protein
MDTATVIRELWTRTQARDWAGVTQLIAPDAVIEWPVSGERFLGRANYVEMNRTYPEGWEIQLRRVIASGDEAASEVAVPHRELGDFRVVSFWTVKNGQVVSGTEYWTSPGSDEPSPGRARYVEHM